MNTELDPDMTPLHLPTASPQPQPAADRPHPVAPKPVSTDPAWWAHLDEHCDIEHLLVQESAYRNARRPWDQPGYREHRRKLRIAQIILLEALDHDPADRLAVAYLSMVNRALDSR